MKRFRLDDTEDHVTEHGLAAGTKLVPAGTVLLLARGMTLLRDLPICVASRPVTFNQDVKALHPQPSIRDDFLPYLLLGNKDRLLDLVDLAGHGTGRLNTDELKALDVRLPPESEQRAIAHILGTLDDKIELNRRMNETLEQVAQAFFKSWFVNFDPVRAKSEGRDPGLPSEIADLFPDSFEESELGEIPKGWEAGPLGAFFTVGLGGAWGDEQPSVKATIAVRCLRGIDCHDLAEGRVPDVPSRWLSTNQTAKRHLVDGAVIVEGSGSFCGRSLLWHSTYGELIGEPVVYSNFCKRLDPICTASQAVVCWFYMRKAYREGELQAFRTGTAFPNFDIHGALADLYVVVPPTELADVFAGLFRSSQRLDLLAQSRTLAALRDALLPKLISGDLRLKDMEQIIEGTRF
jgi:type I restriction enzyme S subunit